MLIRFKKKMQSFRFCVAVETNNYANLDDRRPNWLFIQRGLAEQAITATASECN